MISYFTKYFLFDNVLNKRNINLNLYFLSINLNSDTDDTVVFKK